jgi:hypothetical protein
MSALQRRLARLEEVLLPKPWQPVCMLTEPASDALTEEWADYQQQVEAAKARGDFVIVVAPLKPCEGRRTDKGVTYCASEFEARSGRSVDASVGAWQRQSAGRGAQGCDGQRSWSDGLLLSNPVAMPGLTIALHNAKSNTKHESRHTMCKMTFTR